MLFNLQVKTDYVNYSSYCIQRALSGKDGTLEREYSNGKNKAGKADLKSVLDGMEKEKKNKGKKSKQNDKLWAEIDEYKKSLKKDGVLYHSVLENDIDAISYTGEMTYDEIREENERKEQERKEQERIEIEKERAEIKKKAQEEKKFLSADSPELIKNLEAERKLYNSADYPEETKARYEALLKEKKFAVPKDMDDLISIRCLRSSYRNRSKKARFLQAEISGDTGHQT